MAAIWGSWKTVPTSPLPQLRAYQVESRQKNSEPEGIYPVRAFLGAPQRPSPNAELTFLSISKLHNPSSALSHCDLSEVELAPNTIQNRLDIQASDLDKSLMWLEQYSGKRGTSCRVHTL